MSCANHYSSHHSIGVQIRFFNQGFWPTAPLAMFIGDENEIPISQISRWRYPFLALLHIGIGRASKFLGVRRIFGWIFPNLPEKFCTSFVYKFSPTKMMKTWFGMIFKKEKGLRVFFCKSWAPFFKIKQRWAPFMPGFCPHFQRFCPNFQKIKTVGGALALPAPSLLHHCCCRRGRYSLTHRCQKQSLRSWTALQE